MRYGRDNPHFFEVGRVELCDSQPRRILLDPDTRIFSIGSCFSINFARWMEQQLGVVGPERRDYYFNSATIRRVIENVASDAPMFHGGWRVAGEHGDVFIDGFALTTNGASCVELRHNQLALLRQQREALSIATLAIVTLGLSIVWEERIEDRWVVLNSSPPVSLRMDPRFKIRHQTVSEIKADLRAILDLLSPHQALHNRIVFTVSPIPLKASFTGMDVYSASLYSKASLLAAVHELVEDGDNLILYFPAFEYFWMVLDEVSRFQRDGRHPKVEAIQQICLEFVRRYASDPGRFQWLPNFSVPAV